MIVLTTSNINPFFRTLNLTQIIHCNVAAVRKPDLMITLQAQQCGQQLSEVSAAQHVPELVQDVQCRPTPGLIPLCCCNHTYCDLEALTGFRSVCLHNQHKMHSQHDDLH